MKYYTQGFLEVCDYMILTEIADIMIVILRFSFRLAYNDRVTLFKMTCKIKKYRVALEVWASYQIR